MSRRKINRALISVSDKTGIQALAQALVKENIEIVASDGTAEYLREQGIMVRTVTELTGAPELLGGKVKTLNPLIHAAILADPDDDSEVKQLADLGPIDAVIVNLYPLPGFDIGGPALIRAAAKNSMYVTVLTHPDQYETFISRLATGTSREERNDLALQALITTAEYDLSLAAERGAPLRYGENPHQRATLLSRSSGVAGARILQGKAMSLNNYVDLDAAWTIAMENPKSAVIIKHGMPTGVATHSSANDAYHAALASDPISAFGGVVALNHEVDEKCARAITEQFTEVLAALSFTQKAREVLATKSALRIVEISEQQSPSIEVSSISGGYLVQTADTITNAADNPQSWLLMSGNPVKPELLDDLHFAWRVVARTRSNSIVVSHSLSTIGIGAGNVNRLDAARAAIQSAQRHHPEKLRGSVAASDAFFPFPDALEILAEAGITAIVQPGGSINDGAVIEAARKAGISMYFTGIRHFSH
jgi:phosphoribosylaminoimidazolecarboxamide formyltransferase/IMP cyclohydrolase